jgi:GT2 family glycosyltransferase/glycosyltransferase involved in cell wall biosynthesis
MPTATHPHKDRMVSIVILTYNNIDLTRICVESLIQYTQYTPLEMIFVDNNSQDSTRSYLKEVEKKHTNVQLILNEENLGFAHGNNQGAATAQGAFIVFLNNDTVVTQGWMQGLIRYLDDPESGMVGPVTNSSGNKTRIAVDYKTLDEMHRFAAEYTARHSGQSFEIRMLPFQCVALRRTVFEEIGPLDETFGIGMFEDDDYAIRLRQKGYKILCAEDVFIHHWGSASFSKIGFTNYWQLFKQNRIKFEQKWGEEWIPHTHRPELIPQQYRMYLDNAIQFSDVILDMEKRTEGQRLELQNIYSSNSWALIQKLQRVRHFFIPEHSQRERLLHRFVHSVRRTKQLQRTTPSLTASQKPERDRQTTVPRSRHQQPAHQPGIAAQSIIVGDTELKLRYPWPLVSVILPVYNHADMLESAANSVLFSSYPNIELIEKLPRALTHAHQFASGEFITWTSSDNLLMPETIERLVNGLLCHPEAILAYADVRLIDDQGNRLLDKTYRPQNLDPDHPDILRLYTDGSPLSYEADNYINACFLYRRDAASALEGHFADDLRGLEDFDFWMRMQKGGKFTHIHNQEPLYEYRVHQRTMSHKILTQEPELSAHVERIDNLMEYEQRRREYADSRWHLLLDDSLSDKDKLEIECISQHLAVDTQPTTSQLEPGTKRLRITSSETRGTEIVYARLLPDSWQLTWNSPYDEEQRTLEVWKGVNIHPLALKARLYQPGRDDYADAGERHIAGLHTGLASLPIDIPKTRLVIQSNPNIYFMILDIPGMDDQELGLKIVAGLENATYLGSQPFGEVYRQYACWDAVWLPPLSQKNQHASYRVQLALAYAVARPLIAPRGLTFSPAPYQFYYHSPDESLNFIRQFDRFTMDTTVLNRYLASWSQAGRLQQLLKYADSATQEIFIPRPDFNITPPSITKPSTWNKNRDESLETLKCGLVVNTLDKGGLEEFVAQLALGLPTHNIETIVICNQEGGTIADSLKEKGVRVYLTQGNEVMIRQVLLGENPNILITHLVDNSTLDIAYGLGIPIVEIVQNSYVWFDNDAWQTERKRSRYFTHVVATSQNTLRYYAKWNNALNQDWMTVIPNCIDIDRIQVVDRNLARQKLGIEQDEFLFLTLASYAPAKNQLGLLTAFDRVAASYPQARLWCVGNIADPVYHQKVIDHWERIPAKDKIRLEDFRTDISNLLSAGDAFVLDSVYEGWSLAATEALIAGLPLIHSDCGSAEELVGAEGERGIIVPNPVSAPINLNNDLVNRFSPVLEKVNTQALVNAMEQIIEERNLWLARKDQIRTHAAQEFSFENALDAYAQLFNKILNG